MISRARGRWRGWHEGTAEVRGRIPVEKVLARFCAGPEVLAINRLVVRPELVRMFGPKFEEYVARAV